MQLRNLFISQLKNVCQLILIQATLKRPKGQNLASALGGPRTVSLVFLDQQRSPATFIGRCSYWNQSLFELLRRGTRMSFFQSCVSRQERESRLGQFEREFFRRNIFCLFWDGYFEKGC